MLARTLVEEIARLLKEGKLSRRKIAERLGVSRGTVGAIARGQRTLFGRELAIGERPDRGMRLPAERCPKCGFLVYMPCLVCRSREYRLARQLARSAGLPPPITHRPRRRPSRRGRPTCHARVA